jgi:hypothetical protein
VDAVQREESELAQLSQDATKPSRLDEGEQGRIGKVAWQVFEAAHIRCRQFDVDWRRVGYGQGPRLAELTKRAPSQEMKSLGETRDGR